MIFSALANSLKPVLLMEKASNMTIPTMFYIAIELFAGLNLDSGNNQFKTATKPLTFNQITPRPFSAGLHPMQR